MAFKKIGVLTSGGDGPGMNAAIRAIVRCGIYCGFEIFGIFRGYDGLIDGEVKPLNHRSVASVINRGGTILKTSRSKRFLTEEGQAQAVETIKKNNIDVLITIGGDGTYLGAVDLMNKWNIPTIGLPGTIDNDLHGTDQTIGCHTAVNTALDAIDKIRDTAHSMERIFFIEVMGNRSGYIAIEVAIGSGAETVIIPERPFNFEKIARDILEGKKKGKGSWIVVVAEGAGKADAIADRIKKQTNLETRYVVLGHIQRGGNPTASDRILATRLGAQAVELLKQGVTGKAVGILQDKINVIDLVQAARRENIRLEEYEHLIETLR